MKMMFFVRLILCIVINLCCVKGQLLSNDQIQQKLLAQPPQAIVDLAAKEEPPLSIEVNFVNADLDGSGAFLYYVALYETSDHTGGFLRVFKRQGNNLVLAGDQEKNIPVGGYLSELSLVDINGDGIPEVEVTSSTHDAQNRSMVLFSWTGLSLHNMIGNDWSIMNGGLDDVDGDGIMELITDNSDGKGFDIFKLAGNNYQFFKTVKQDPTGASTADGRINYVRSFCTILSPNKFRIEEINIALLHHEKDREDHDDVVQLSFGGLERLHAGRISVEQVDITTIVVSPRLMPVRINTHREGVRGEDVDGNNKDGCRSHQEKISVDVPRSQFLKGLQKLHLDGPLKTGDQIEVKVLAKLKDGTPVSAMFKATIVGEHDQRDESKGHHSRISRDRRRIDCCCKLG
jgi:hypothetical protein